MNVNPNAWVVYRVSGADDAPAVMALCEQRQWPEIERCGRGRCTLVRGNIPNEGEAERMARGTAGDPPPGTKRRYQGHR